MAETTVDARARLATPQVPACAGAKPPANRRQCRPIGGAVAVLVVSTLTLACTTSTQQSAPTAAREAVAPKLAAAKTNACGTERWSVKTLSDKKADAVSVDLATAQSISITDVNAKAAHCHPGQTLGRFYSEESQLYKVTGWALVVKQEADRDYHIGLYENDDEESPSMVVEVVDPTCPGASASQDHAQLVAARASLNSISGGNPLSLIGQRLTVIGVGFFDREHGQTGLSSSCMEVHPVLDVAKAP